MPDDYRALHALHMQYFWLSVKWHMGVMNTRLEDKHASRLALVLA